MILSPREELINKIGDVLENEFPEIDFSDFDISRIIYNNNKFIKDDFLHIRKIKMNSRPDLLVLMKIIYNIQKLETYHIESLNIISVSTPLNINNIKRDLRKIITYFIFKNPLKVKYIKQDNRTKFQRDTNYWRPEFELFLDLWYAVSLNNKEPITIKTFQQEI